MGKAENKYTLKEIITFMGKRKTKEIKHPKKYTLLEAKSLSMTSKRR